MKKLMTLVTPAMALFMLATPSVFASSHREAPITALDRTADVTDWYAFVSYDDPTKVTFMLNVDPLLEPANGPNYFPFDDNVLYEMHVDNTQSGMENVTFQFRFHTEIRQPNLFTGFVGGIAGIPPITSLNGPGSQGFSLRQTYKVLMVNNGVTTCISCGQTLYAVPSNAGPRTMPNYQKLFNQGIYTLGGNVRVWAGTADDPFFIDLGAAFDSLNFRKNVGPILSPAVDADDTHNYAPDAVGGFNVNSIVLEVPITMLTVDGQMHPAGDKRAVIGTWGSTARPKVTVRDSPSEPSYRGAFQYVNREGNSLINELIIGTGSKDRFSMDVPSNDSQFASFVTNPVLAQVFASLGLTVPPAPRNDLVAVLAQYGPPICPGCGSGDAGPVADLLRLNTGIGPTAVGSQKRLGFIAGDNAGYPNGRRPVDDVVDISARAVAGILAGPQYNYAIGDGVQTKADGLNNSFPYLMPANSGRNSDHVGPGQAGCSGYPNDHCPVQ